MEEQNNKSDYSRLEQVIFWAKLSTHAFAMAIGMKRSENLYRIIRYKENISIKLADMILKKYPEINFTWLITGEGDMLTEMQLEAGLKVPFYESLNKPISFYFSIPSYKEADFAIRVKDDAMAPQIPKDAILFATKNSSDIIIYGKIYLIELKKITLVRIVRKVKDCDEKILLEPLNVDHFDSITVEMKDVKNLFLVSSTFNDL